MGLALVILLCSFAVPVSAAEVEKDDVFFNVLDYAYPNEGNVFNIYGEGSASCYFKLPTNRVVKYVDMIVTLNSGTSGLTAQIGGPSKKIDLYVEWISGYTYRVYGNVGYGSNYIYTYFTATDLTYVVFEKFECAYQQLTQYDTDGYCGILAPGSNYAQTIHYVPTDETNSRSFPAMGGVDNNEITLTIWTDNWKKYDYLDVRLIFHTSAITSIDAYLGNQVLDLQVSEITSLNWDTNQFFISLRLDLTQISRVTDNSPTIVISGLTPYDGTVLVNMQTMSGFLISDSGNPLFSYLRDLKSSLGQWFKSLENALKGDSGSGDAFKEDSSGLIGELGDISASMDAVDRPSMDNIDTNFTADITDASVLMTSIFTELTSVSWLARFILASCTIGLISYILYGKE